VKRLVPVILLVASTAQAQDMRAMLGRPLPDPQRPAGTVSVRVSKNIPMNGVPGVEVTAVIVKPGGEGRKKVVSTDPEGRAVFEGLEPGGTFEASATVDGEQLQVGKFPIPSSGGVRVILVAALGAGGPPPPEAAGEEPNFNLAAVAGKVEPAQGLPAGTLELTLRDEGGKPIAGRLVQLGQVSKESALKVHKATSSEAGLVRFEGLPTGEGTGYAALIEHQGMRLTTEVFRMDPGTGMRGEIRALGHTSDPSVLRFDSRSRLILEVGEDALQMMEELVLKSTSSRAYDPGAEGLLLPLPDGFEGAREIEGASPIDIRAGQGAALKMPVTPGMATKVRVGFVIPASGNASVEVRQKLPFPLEGALLLIPASANLTVDGPGLRERPAQADAQGNAVKLYEVDAIPAGRELVMTVRGLPALAHTGRNIAGVLCLLLIAAAAVGSPRPPKVARAVASAAQLTERREKLFGELVTLEQQRKAKAGRDSTLDERRQELVAKLENVYRELAGVEHGHRAQL
jgi:hypothetical protein